jgi:hypothetical protein
VTIGLPRMLGIVLPMAFAVGDPLPVAEDTFSCTTRCARTSSVLSYLAVGSLLCRLLLLTPGLSKITSQQQENTEKPDRHRNY